MSLIEISKTQFNEYAKNHPLANYEQSSYFANLKEKEGWHPYFLALEEKNRVKGATLLLAKEAKITKKRYFYAPHGFLIDYTEEELVKRFTKEIIAFIKEKKGILLKIDPYISKIERDKNGEIILGGYNRDFIENNLEQIGFEKVNNTVQPKWFYQINLKGKNLDNIMEDMEPKARQIIRRNERLGFKTRELVEEEFIILIQQLKKKNTLNYSENFYNELYKSFGKDHFKIITVEITPKTIIHNMQEEMNSLKQKKRLREQAYQIHKITKETYINQEEEEKKKQENIEKNILIFKEKEQDKPILLGGYIYLLFGKEVIAFQGAMVEEYIHWDASYNIHYQMIKYAIENNYETYNFSEIPEPMKKEHPLYTSYQYKKKFGGQVIELLGEFDYRISKKAYPLYKTFFPKF